MKKVATNINNVNDNLMSDAELKDCFGEMLNFGVSLGNSNGKPCYLQTKDRYCHMAIMGQTGCGKSNLIHQMEREDIVSGAGVAIIASHDEDALYPLNCVPEERLDDVVFIDATDEEYCPCINPLGVDFHDEKAKNEAVERVIDVIVSENHTEWIGPRFQQMARAALNLLLSNPTIVPNFKMVAKCFTDPDFVKSCLKYVNSESLFNFWTKSFVGSCMSNDFSDVCTWVASKFDAIIENETMGRLFRSEKKTVDFGDIVNNNKILVVFAPASEIGEEASRIIKKFILSELRDAIMKRGNKNLRSGLISRQKQNKEEIPPFFMYVDEFGEVASLEYVKFFAQVRKRNVGCIVSFQNLSQLVVVDKKTCQRSSALLDSVLANMGSYIAYSACPADAILLSERFGVSTKVLNNIDKYHANAFLRKDGQITGPIDLSVPLKPANNSNEMAELIYLNLATNGVLEDMSHNNSRQKSDNSKKSSDSCNMKDGSDKDVNSSNNGGISSSVKSNDNGLNNSSSDLSDIDVSDEEIKELLNMVFDSDSD